MSTILITGGLGFIGHNVSAQLEAQGHDVVIVDTQTDYGVIPQAELSWIMAERKSLLTTPNIYSIDIADSGGIDYVMRRHRPQIVIHLASFPRQKVVNSNPGLGARTMSEGLLNLLESSTTHGLERFVYVSSSMVYGNFHDQTSEWGNCNPQGQYGILKLAGEWLVHDYHQRGCFDHCIIRPSAVYGPRDVEDRVVSRFLLAAMRGETLRVRGAQECLDFSYVDDVAAGVVAATLHEQSVNRTFNITRGQSRTLLEAAELAVSIAGRGTIEVLDRDLAFPSRGSLNISAAQKCWGYNPQIDIEQGFQKYHDWLARSLYRSPKTVS